MLNDLAEAMKALDGKKECGGTALFGCIVSAQRQFYCMFLIFASIASKLRWLRSIILQVCIPPL